MTYLILAILSLYIFDPFKRLNGGVIGWARRLGDNQIIDLRKEKLREYENAAPSPPSSFDDSTYTKPEESLLERTKLYHESIDQKPFNEGDIL